MTQPRLLDMINYSPSPKSAYQWILSGHSYGPATSQLLDTQEIWNLAYLSYNYDAKRDHSDPQFTTNVRRTAQCKLDGSGPDMTGLGKTPTVANLLRLPAPRFVMLIKAHAIVQTLPLFKAYGQDWLTTIEARSWLCKVDGYDPPPLSAAAVIAGTDYLRNLAGR